MGDYDLKMGASGASVSAGYFSCGSTYGPVGTSWYPPATTHIEGENPLPGGTNRLQELEREQYLNKIRCERDYYFSQLNQQQTYTSKFGSVQLINDRDKAYREEMRKQDIFSKKTILLKIAKKMLNEQKINERKKSMTRGINWFLACLGIAVLLNFGAILNLIKVAITLGR